MALKNDRYTYRVTWSEDDHEYVGLCAEFPSLSWLAKNPDAALRGIRNLVAECVQDLKDHGEDIPGPISCRKYSGSENSKVFTNVFLNRKKPMTVAFAVSPSRLMQRITVQKGIFICQGDVSKKFDENIAAMKGYDDRKNLVRLVIPREKRREYIEKLFDMNISRASLFPGLEGFASSLSVFHHLYENDRLKKSVYRDEYGESVWELEKKAEGLNG